MLSRVVLRTYDDMQARTLASASASASGAYDVSSPPSSRRSCETVLQRTTRLGQGRNLTLTTCPSPGDRQR